MADDLQYTPDMGDADRLKELYEAARFDSLAAFARKAGIPEGTAQKHKDRDSIPKAAGAKYIAAAKTTGADLAWLLTGRGAAPRLNLQSPPQVHKLNISPNPDARPLDAPNMAAIPLWQAESIGAGAAVGRIAKTANTVPGLGDLQGLLSVFAVRVWDDANAPWMAEGSTIYIDPTNGGRDNDWCIFATGTENDDGILLNPLVGIRLGKTPLSWRVQRGGQRVTLPLSDYPIVWKVVYIKP